MRLEPRKRAFLSGGKEIGDVHFTGNKTSTPTQGKECSLASLALWPLASRCCCSLVPLFFLLWRWRKVQRSRKEAPFRRIWHQIPPALSLLTPFCYSSRFIAALNHGGKSSKEQQWRLNSSAFLPLPERVNEEEGSCFTCRWAPFLLN